MTDFEPYRDEVLPDRFQRWLELLRRAVGIRTKGEFTAALGDADTAPTATMKWSMTGNKVTLVLDAAMVAASSSTALSIDNLPASLQPTQTQLVPCGELQDNSVGEQAGAARVSAGSNIQLRLAAVSGAVMTYDAAGFTGANNKGVGATWSISYDLFP